MRDRLVAAQVGMTITMIALYGIPHAYLLADLVTTQENQKVERSADLLAVVVSERTNAASPVTASFLDGFLSDGEGIEYVAADDTVVRAGEPVTGTDDIVQKRGLPGGGIVTISRSGSLVGAARLRGADAVDPHRPGTGRRRRVLRLPAGPAHLTAVR